MGKPKPKKSDTEKSSKTLQNKPKTDLSDIFGGTFPNIITGAHVDHLHKLYSLPAFPVEYESPSTQAGIFGPNKLDNMKKETKLGKKGSFDGNQGPNENTTLGIKCESRNIFKNKKSGRDECSLKLESLSVDIDKSISCPVACSNDDTSLADSRHNSIKQLISNQNILNDNRRTLKQANFLRYRENVFRAATRLTQDMPPYPDWVYQNEEIKYQDIYKINVGGVIFFLFDDTLKNLVHTKLANCIRKHKNIGIPFFDRDPKCFNAILNFYRTGRLHVPANTCLTLYDRELEFWGINEMFIEPCCWSSFYSLKVATNTVKKFVEDIVKSNDFEAKPRSIFRKWRIQLNAIMTDGSGSIKARWMSTLSTVFIILSILGMITSTTSFGRVDIKTSLSVAIKPDESVSDYFIHTRNATSLNILEVIICVYFLAELIARLLLCSKRLEFFADTLNWVDFLATTMSLFATLFLENTTGGNIEGYVLILKLPRILRLFKLTTNLRSGMEAFTLTIKASAKELRLVFLMMIMAAALFGTLIFVVEMVSETETRRSKVKNIYIGIWLGIVTMTTVGYGDYHAMSYTGYFVTSCCILCGVIICQLPVPIFLMNFRIYHNQASARLSQNKKLIVRNADPESINDADINHRIHTRQKKKGQKTFAKLFNHI